MTFKYFVLSFTKHFLSWLPDSLYLRLVYYGKMGKWLNLSNPKTFNEKLQWLKLHQRDDKLTTMVDKYLVKSYVSKLIGEEHIIPTLGVWDKFEDIDFDTLPDKFVLKTTHGGGGGGVVICSDKKQFNKDTAKIKLEKSLMSDIYKNYREWPYKNVKRRIIAEQFVEIPQSNELKDYKFFCFNGEPKFLKVDFNRFVEHHANYYDLEWNLLTFGEVDCSPNYDHIEERPQNFEKMLDLARQLSCGFPFLRVDLYNNQGMIYFGELTFFPASGLGPFTSKECDYKLGSFLEIR